jgi:hypothetical protein
MCNAECLNRCFSELGYRERSLSVYRTRLCGPSKMLRDYLYPTLSPGTLTCRAAALYIPWVPQEIVVWMVLPCGILKSRWLCWLCFVVKPCSILDGKIQKFENLSKKAMYTRKEQCPEPGRPGLQSLVLSSSHMDLPGTKVRCLQMWNQKPKLQGQAPPSR